MVVDSYAGMTECMWMLLAIAAPVAFPRELRSPFSLCCTRAAGLSSTGILHRFLTLFFALIQWRPFRHLGRYGAGRKPTL